MMSIMKKRGIEYLLFIILLFLFSSYVFAAEEYFYTPSCEMITDPELCSNSFTQTGIENNNPIYLKCKYSPISAIDQCHRFALQQGFNCNTINIATRDVEGQPGATGDNLKRRIKYCKEFYSEDLLGKHNCVMNIDNECAEIKSGDEPRICYSACTSADFNRCKQGECNILAKSSFSSNLKPVDHCSLDKRDPFSSEDKCLGSYIIDSEFDQDIAKECIPAVRDASYEFHFGRYSLECRTGINYCFAPVQEDDDFNCNDNFDNDCDGFIDCQDSDCDGTKCTFYQGDQLKTGTCINQKCILLGNVKLAPDTDFLKSLKVDIDEYVKETDIPKGSGKTFLVVSPYDKLTCKTEVDLSLFQDLKLEEGDIMFEIPSNALPKKGKCQISEEGNKLICSAKFDSKTGWFRGDTLSCSAFIKNSDVKVNSNNIIVARYIDYFLKYGAGPDPKELYKTYVENTAINKISSRVGKAVYFTDFPVKVEPYDPEYLKLRGAPEYYCSRSYIVTLAQSDKCKNLGGSFCSSDCGNLPTKTDSNGQGCGGGLQCCANPVCESDSSGVPSDTSCYLDTANHKCIDCTLLGASCYKESTSVSGKDIYRCRDKNNENIFYPKSCAAGKGVCLTISNGLESIPSGDALPADNTITGRGIGGVVNISWSPPINCPAGSNLKCFKKETCQSDIQKIPIDNSCTYFNSKDGKCINCNLYGPGMKCTRYYNIQNIIQNVKYFLFDNRLNREIFLIDSEDSITLISNIFIGYPGTAIPKLRTILIGEGNILQVFLHERLHLGSADTKPLCDEYSETEYFITKQEFKDSGLGECSNDLPRCCLNPADPKCTYIDIKNCRGFPYIQQFIKDNDKKGEDSYGPKFSVMGFNELWPNMVVPCGPQISWPFVDPKQRCDNSALT